MRKDLTEVQRQGDHNVDLGDERELEHWSHQFGVSKDELRGPRPGM